MKKMTEKEFKKILEDAGLWAYADSYENILNMISLFQEEECEKLSKKRIICSCGTCALRRKHYLSIIRKTRLLQKRGIENKKRNS